MALNFKKTESTRTPIERLPDGAYPARVVQIIDIGVQEDTFNASNGPAPKVFIQFEFPTETIDIDGEAMPRWLGREYKVFTGEKAALTQLVKALDPSGEKSEYGANVEGLLGLPCMVTVGSTKSDKAKISSVTGLPKGFSVPELANDSFIFDMDNPDPEIWEKLPDWMKNKIREANNYSKSALSEIDVVTDAGFAVEA